MIILILFAFLAGIVTILSPCILPVLPIVLSGATGTDKSRPLGIITGFIFSFTFFTLFLTSLVQATGISADSLRTLSIIILLLFGISLLFPQFQAILEKLFNYFSVNFSSSNDKKGLWGGLIIGLSLGLLWTPCVGPILAAVISLALTGSVSSTAFLITLAYALGTAIPMFAIMIGGRELLNRNQWLVRNTVKIQKIFGILMILTALAIWQNWDRQFQTYVLEKFPTYGTGLTKLEDNNLVQNSLTELSSPNSTTEKFSLPGKEYPPAPEIVAGGEWINSDPLKIEDLKGKVVLIDFWTYSCINCIRTLPYLRSWYDKYADQGFVIIGVHTPEFEFEKDIDNVREAVNDFGLKYPIVQDNNYQTWRAYDNHYWPAKYLINKDGKIVYTHFGEGDYDETEEKIQQLLEETGADVSSERIDNPTYQVQTRTPETYLGFGRMEYLVSPERIMKNSVKKYSLPKNQPTNSFAFSGNWTITEEYSQSEIDATLVEKFQAKDVYLVMNSDQPAQVVVKLDDQLISSDQAGDDVDEEGRVTVSTDRLYHLVSLSEPGNYTLTLEFPDGMIRVFAFTFG